MIVQKVGIQYSPNDLLRFLDSNFVSWMDRASEINLELKKKYTRSESELTKKLFEEGLSRERILLKSYKQAENAIDIQGNKKFDLKYFDLNLKKTREAMMQGRKYIVQAYLKKNNFFGVADLLERVDGVPSLFGNYYYVVKDAKMSQSPKSSFVIQICAYCDILESMQGVRPQTASVLLGNNQEVNFLVEDYYQFYLNLKQEFINFHNNFKIDKIPTPSLKDNLWYWEDAAKDILTQKDDISLIADIEKEEVKILKEQGLQTNTQILNHPDCPGISSETWERIKKQVKLQKLKENKIEILPHDICDPRGLYLLPPATESDIYCEIKTAPTIDGGEYIYLYNFYFKKDQQWIQESIECSNPAWEKGYLAKFLKKIHSLIKDKGTIFFFGDSNYDKILKKSAQHSTYLSFVEKIFFTNRIIDLKYLIKQSLVLNVSSYSFPEVSRALGFDCEFEDSEFALFTIKSIGSKSNKDWATQELAKLLLLKMQALKYVHQKLEQIQKEQAIDYKKIELQEELFQDEEENILFLGENFNQEKYETASESEKIQLLIKQLMKFNFHESKPKKIETAMLLQQDLNKWRKSPRALTNLIKEQILDLEKRIIEYKFSLKEETKIKQGDSVILYKNTNMRAKIIDLDEVNGKIILALTKKSFENFSMADQISILEDNHIPTTNIDKANAIFKELFNVDLPYWGLPKCLYDFLLKKHPDIKDHEIGIPLYSPEDNFLNTISDKISKLQESSIVIQGPPGAGKTFTSANVILNLITQGKRIAISSNSHKAINNLLLKLRELDSSLSIGKLGEEIDEELLAHNIINVDKDELDSIREIQVLGGTVFGLMKGVGKFDYIFIDEAGQVGLSAILVYSLIAKNLVLIGDQMQLEQPIQAVHPGDSGKSALEYYLDNWKTVPIDRGFFLSESRRMNEELCRVVSDLFYEGKLKSHSSANQRELKFLTRGIINKSKGVEFINVPHRDNTQHSIEEVEKIKEIVDYLLGQRIILDGVEKNITLNDLIFVSPYNMQVSKLRKAFPEARVGSVDLFQGQEAPIVIYSLAASTPGARGIEFLLNEHRINVALSRGQALAIVVGSEYLAQVSPNKLSELKLLNMFLKLKKNN